ncbi:hypothetical protein ACHAWF_016603 [Thalassiosira exigua]
MPARTALHRLESYQSGGSVGGGVDAGSGRDDGSAAASDADVPASDVPAPDADANPAPPPPRRPLLSQFSLIGRADSGVDDVGGGGGGSRWSRSPLRRWRFDASGRGRTAAAMIVLALLSGSALLLRTSPSPSSGPSTSKEDGEEGGRSSCPARSSRFVSSEVMALKNSSCVENAAHGAVAADQPVCSLVGVSILRDSGGNAADAAVAAALCAGVVNPASSGIGGGGFGLVRSDRDRWRERTSGEEGGIESFAASFEDAREKNNVDAPRTTTANDSMYGRWGGGGKKVTEFIDCRETAPGKATFDMYESDPKSSTLGGLAVAVPGELRGLELLHRRHGSLPWSDVVRPAMELARDGFAVGPYLAGEIRDREKYWRSTPELGRLLTKDRDGVTPLREGDVLVRRAYGKTLEAVMEGGADALYRGELGRTLAKESFRGLRVLPVACTHVVGARLTFAPACFAPDIRDAGGIITSADISNYRPVLRDPLISRVSGYAVVGAPPPSSGGSAIVGALRFLSGFSVPYSALADALSKHRYVEACRHVFAIRMSLSDPKFAPEDNAAAVRDLIEGEYMEALRKTTSDDGTLSLSRYGGATWARLNDTEGTGALVDAQEGDRRRRRTTSARTSRRTGGSDVASRNLRLFNYLDDHGTSSLSVVDKHRNAVTITTSVNLNFGSKVVSPSTGIVLNNQMDDFSSPGRVNFFGLRPSASNYPAPGKRPLSSMAPTMVFRDVRRDGTGGTDDVDDLGKLVLSLGASGGPKIITSIVQTILNYAFVGMPLYESVAAPRVHNQLLYHGSVGSNVEEVALPQGPPLRVSNRTLAALKKRGHQLIPSGLLGTVQAVAVDSETDSLTAVADVRKQGRPAGY